MDLGLRDRVYVLTGASRGLGFAAARVLVEERARVVLTGRDGAAVRAAVDELGGADVACGIEADNADPTTGPRAVRAARDAYGRVDGALISGPSPRPGHLADVTGQDWRAGFESVFLGALGIAGAVAGAAGRGGSILFVLATTARAPMARLAISSGLRPGLAMVAKLLADELGPAGVRVNSLLPGRVTTDSLREIDATTGAPGSDEPGRRPRDAAVLGRDSSPEEFARVAAFVLAPAASSLTGTSIVMDGGALRVP
jgi:3-oxoacyl-[acyl-carrier protein] reductase